MKTKSIFILAMVGLCLFVADFAKAESASCTWDRKDYDSPGFGIPKRKGLYIVGRFGCLYSCECGGRKDLVTHVLYQKHLDINFSSESQTGGGSRAKWYICPHSIKPDSWTPRRDELGRIMYYDVEVDDRSFSPQSTKLIPELQAWEAKNCQ